MSKNRVVVPACLLNDFGLAAPLLQPPLVRRFDVGAAYRTDRPAWQSPYGPPPRRGYRARRAHRAQWAPAPTPARSRSALRPGYLCGRCD